MSIHDLRKQGILLETGNQAPRHRKEHVWYIVWLSNDCKPAIDHNVIACVCLNRLRVVDSLPRHLRERIPLGKLALLLVAERVLLAICTVPHPVEKDVQDRENCEGVSVPVIFRWGMVGQVKCTMAISERHTSHIPEGEQKAKLFEIHVPFPASV